MVDRKTAGYTLTIRTALLIKEVCITSVIQVWGRKDFLKKTKTERDKVRNNQLLIALKCYEHFEKGKCGDELDEGLQQFFVYCT